MAEILASQQQKHINDSHSVQKATKCFSELTKNFLQYFIFANLLSLLKSTCLRRDVSFTDERPCIPSSIFWVSFLLSSLPYLQMDARSQWQSRQMEVVMCSDGCVVNHLLLSCVPVSVTYRQKSHQSEYWPLERSLRFQEDFGERKVWKER